MLLPFLYLLAIPLALLPMGICLTRGAKNTKAIILLNVLGIFIGLILADTFGPFGFLILLSILIGCLIWSITGKTKDEWEREQKLISGFPRSMPPPLPQREDIATQIEKLGALRDRGLLTEEEFQVQKRSVLTKG